MKIAVAQMDAVVGDFGGNVDRILSAYDRANGAGARILMTPELGVCGYPPLDLMERAEMISWNEAALAILAKATKGKACALLVGHVSRNPSATGRGAFNSVSVLENGREVFRQDKTLLPTYDVFDEARHFEGAEKSDVWVCDGHRIGIAVCEDLWASHPVLGRRLYGKDPVERLADLNLELLLSVSASPYEWGKRVHREAVHAEVVRKLGIPLVYVNQVGATDEILFDGESFALDSKGKVLGRLPAFEESDGIFEWSGASGRWLSPDALHREDQAADEMVVLERALVSGLRGYFQRTGFKSAILGLSGGIDSAVTAVLASQALGPEQVTAVAMPSQYSSGHSLEDAELLARNLGIRFEVRPIKFAYSQLSREFSEGRGELAQIALENLQSRIRGMILMTLANHENALVLTTGNKSEYASGYATLYGDMVGALAPIGDLLKTRVYALGHHLNRNGVVIPERTLTKVPSAELRPNQTDQDVLPPYEVLDAIIEDWIELGVPVEELEKKHGDRVRETLLRIERNEFKRRQAAPVLKVSARAFGIGRRVPVAKNWDLYGDFRS